jgi:Arc/MetJ-type ribon-helix-helix transcriptional regulator
MVIAMQVSLNPDVEAFLQQKIAMGETPDTIINKAVAYLRDSERQYDEWLRTELHRGEESGEPIPYTPSLLDEIEEEVLAELDAEDEEIDPRAFPKISA